MAKWEIDVNYRNTLVRFNVIVSFQDCQILTLRQHWFMVGGGGGGGGRKTGKQFSENF